MIVIKSEYASHNRSLVRNIVISDQFTPNYSVTTYKCIVFLMEFKSWTLLHLLKWNQYFYSSLVSSVNFVHVAKLFVCLFVFLFASHRNQRKPTDQLQPKSCTASNYIIVRLLHPQAVCWVDTPRRGAGITVITAHHWDNGQKVGKVLFCEIHFFSQTSSNTVISSSQDIEIVPWAI